jgi:hypothetical protein
MLPSAVNSKLPVRYTFYNRAISVVSRISGGDTYLTFPPTIKFTLPVRDTFYNRVMTLNFVPTSCMPLATSSVSPFKVSPSSNFAHLALADTTYIFT